ncbi:hypothetical protein EVAR_64727_1 [Eumeta japonica]|uniref:Uncharacterized protein n=1 Tax=Eumeta variegata TaxID=151549 RepID=A0A4C1ZZN4_EUMVA|nr:hypothetical protein EVAR_64727_1 [Eumeta japonica]
MCTSEYLAEECGLRLPLSPVDRRLEVNKKKKCLTVKESIALQSAISASGLSRVNTGPFARRCPRSVPLFSTLSGHRRSLFPLKFNSQVRSVKPFPPFNRVPFPTKAISKLRVRWEVAHTRFRRDCVRFNYNSKTKTQPKEEDRDPMTSRLDRPQPWRSYNFLQERMLKVLATITARWFPAPARLPYGYIPVTADVAPV